MSLSQIEKKHSPELIAEAAMCIWEAMLDQKPPLNERHTREGKHTWQSQMGILWDNYGTVEMRHYAYRLALSALEVFEKLGFETAEEMGLIPYDWEFIPAVVSHADWTDLYAADNSPERIEREIREMHDA